jgi:hypothetical protein
LRRKILPRARTNPARARAQPYERRLVLLLENDDVEDAEALVAVGADLLALADHLRVQDTGVCPVLWQTLVLGYAGLLPAHEASEGERVRGFEVEARGTPVGCVTAPTPLRLGLPVRFVKLGPTLS